MNLKKVYGRDVKPMEPTSPEFENWCMALRGNHDEHQCHKKPGHDKEVWSEEDEGHECYCGVWW